MKAVITSESGCPDTHIGKDAFTVREYSVCLLDDTKPCRCLDYEDANVVARADLGGSTKVASITVVYPGESPLRIVGDYILRLDKAKIATRVPTPFTDRGTHWF